MVPFKHMPRVGFEPGSKRDFSLLEFVISVVYFDQLLGAACTRKLVKLLFSAVFNLNDIKTMLCPI